MGTVEKRSLRTHNLSITLTSGFLSPRVGNAKTMRGESKERAELLELAVCQETHKAVKYQEFDPKRTPKNHRLFSARNELPISLRRRTYLALDNNLKLHAEKVKR